MKELSIVFYSLLLFLCFSCNENEDTENQGIDGFSTLFYSDGESLYYDACSGGNGIKISYGLDLDRNNEISINEIENSFYICSLDILIDQQDSMRFALQNLIGTDTCNTGGVVIKFGNDLNLNGNLDQNEYELNNFVFCDGEGGENGVNYIIKQEMRTCGTNSAFFLKMGLDENSDGILSNIEADNFFEFCNNTYEICLKI